MMQLKVIGSSSHGNCYLLDNGRECLMLEAGMHPNFVKKALNWDIGRIKALLVSHEHGDHSKYSKQWIHYGVPCVKPYESQLKSAKYGNFKIKSFRLVHDVQTYGFVVNHCSFGNLVFITDTRYVPYTFDKIDILMVEANFDEYRLQKNVDEGLVSSFVAKKIALNHMSIQKLIEFLKKQDISRLRRIVLLHTSDKNSNISEFKEKIIKETGKPVSIAEDGQFNEINIEKI
ncbi:MAG: MBL fold metallo-hydrolase [Bacteroidales bacterium]|nr:MBL fold metallo-hydrolase [Bacteroidales bacterium]